VQSLAIADWCGADNTVSPSAYLLQNAGRPYYDSTRRIAAGSVREARMFSHRPQEKS